jgi:transposase
MVKYNEEFKLKIVKEYQTGEMGYKLLARKYGIPDLSPIKKWVNLYTQYGEDGLKRKKTKESYSVICSL